MSNTLHYGKIKKIQTIGVQMLSFFFIAAAVVFVDLLSKIFVVRYMGLNESIPIIKNIFHLTYVQNPGAAFGILAYRTGFFVLAALIVVSFIIIYLRHLPQGHSMLRFALALQLGGVLGNLIDRLRLGYVIDFLDFRVWPVFNLADIAIVIGIGLLILDLARSPRKKGI